MKNLAQKARHRRVEAIATLSCLDRNIFDTPTERPRARTAKSAAPHAQAEVVGMIDRRAA